MDYRKGGVAMKTISRIIGTHKIKAFFSLLILTIGLIAGSTAYAFQPQVVLFCSGWNMKCRDAKRACAYSAQALGIGFTDFDIDQDNASQKARALGVGMPPSIPYIFVFDESGKTALEINYRGEDQESLKNQIMRVLKR